MLSCSKGNYSLVCVFFFSFNQVVSWCHLWSTWGKKHTGKSVCCVRREDLPLLCALSAAAVTAGFIRFKYNIPLLSPRPGGEGEGWGATWRRGVFLTDSNSPFLTDGIETELHGAGIGVHLKHTNVFVCNKTAWRLTPEFTYVSYLGPAVNLFIGLKHSCVRPTCF